ncbi:MAG: histidine kinase, partial [Nitrospinaceae bacterium]|nr:histidine kinase [Nitrospinaceae bacterium]NIR57820.1 histidine kinase [Nitrospinaceae bacterium]NIS88283.1 histidine kinase [Nitrospinaceae bacterium]NIT85160.1 histidine kinase [Nitrospinaceae bacterium]NIU47316.1 histidine kinase [Nitrospinaceae bacterium]
VVLMNPEDMEGGGFLENQPVTVRNETGVLKGLKVCSYPIRSGNIMMYYPEANILVPRSIDERSRTPSFKSFEVVVEKEQ